MASASFLVPSRGHIDQQKLDEEIRLSSEQRKEIRSKLEDNLHDINLKKKYIQAGIQYLIKAFFIFMAELVANLLFFNGYFEKIPLQKIHSDIIIGLFEILPFLLALSLLIIEAEYIRRAYTK